VEATPVQDSSAAQGYDFERVFRRLLDCFLSTATPAGFNPSFDPYCERSSSKNSIHNGFLVGPAPYDLQSISRHDNFEPI
jgi:hypothetical protein